MNETTSYSSFQTNTFGFNLPCRQFAISAERTRERRLPMVDEFILRTLYVVPTISANRLARFFGFEGRDLGISISDLQSRALVKVEGENLSLHPSAKELFRTSDASAPTITVAEPMHADVWFDLITRHMVGRRGLRNVQNLITLASTSNRELFGANEARAAFHANFRDYLRLVQHDKNADQWSLYSILDVHPGRYSFAQIGGSEVLKLSPAPHLETSLLSTQHEQGNRVRMLTEAMTSALARRTYIESSQAARKEFSRLTATDSLDRGMKVDGTLDLLEWFGGETMAGRGDSAPMVGYPYVERNRKTIVSLLSDANIPSDANDRWELWWLRPGGSKWGCTEDLGATLEALRSNVRLRTQGGTLMTTLIAPAAASESDTQVFQRVFDRGLHAPAGKASLALELLVIPDILAVVTVMVPLSPTVSVPIGHATIDPQQVEMIIQKSRMDMLIPEARRLWPRHKSKV